MLFRASTELNDETLAWCRRSHRILGECAPPIETCLALVRTGIVLRRQWDLADRNAPQRRRLLTLLADSQIVCQQRLATTVEDGDTPEADSSSADVSVLPTPSGDTPDSDSDTPDADKPGGDRFDVGGQRDRQSRVDHCHPVDRGHFAEQKPNVRRVRYHAPDQAHAAHVIRCLTDDDAYLAQLLDDHTLSADAVAFAIECFRDDLHWLGTLVALLDGNRGIDFTGRVLLEQESLQRAMEALDREERQTTASHGPVPTQLREAAQRLRTTALARQAASLLNHPDPTDLAGWYRCWRAASRLSMRPKGATDAQVEEAVAAYRAKTIAQWQKRLEKLPVDDRGAMLEDVAADLANLASESLTFLDDLPPAEAIQSLDILAEDVGVCMRMAEAHDACRVKEGDAPRLRPLRRRLRRRRKAIAAERQDRRLETRLDQLLGHRAVAAMERTILALLLLFVVMLVVERPLIHFERLHMPGGTLVEATCAWIDFGICIIFLAEFGLKMALARPPLFYLRRNWITGLMPAIPVGFIAYIMHPDRVDVEVAGELFVLLRALRYLRLPQMARWLRMARPVLRIVRLVGFVMQASDRLVHRIAPLLNRNLVLFERATIKAEQPLYRTQLAALRERFRYRASEVLEHTSTAVRLELVQARIEDLTAMLSSDRCGQLMPLERSNVAPSREASAEQVIARLLASTPAGVSEQIGRTLAQSVARWCQAFDIIGIRRLPLIRDIVAAGRRPSPYGTTAQVANRLGSHLKQMLDRVYWVADLYGTLTAPQLVDSVGEWMVKRTATPARRLLIAGIAFLVVSYLASLLAIPEGITKSLRGLFGAPLVIMGFLCLIPLSLGLWFRDIAGEATDFCSQVAEAQFLTATKKLKRRLASRQHAILYNRVLVPEMQLDQCDSSDTEVSSAVPENQDARKLRDGEPRDGELRDGELLAEGATAEEVAVRAASDADSCDAPAIAERTDGAFGSTVMMVECLFDDYLDGAPFHRNDTKTTTQLLGNLALISLRETRLRYGRRERKRLRRLDLANSRVRIRGPYLWFHFISRSLAHQTAKLTVDYNVNALSLDRAATAQDEHVRRHIEWLSRRCGVPIAALQLDETFRRRWKAMNNGLSVDALPADESSASGTVYAKGATRGGRRYNAVKLQRRAARRVRGFHGNDFTAIHFLSADAAAVADIECRYGDEVARLMMRDRRDNIRRVFRTYPFHLWPRRQRTFNPLAFYGRYMAGGRVLLLPVRTAWWIGKLATRSLRLMTRFVVEVLNPTIGDLHAVENTDPYAVAVRKIHRMRQPVFLECLQMRAEFDPEYLGVMLVGSNREASRTTAAPIEDDLDLIDAERGIRQRFRQLATERRRQVSALRKLLGECNIEETSDESLRAMTIAYTIDYDDVRSGWEAIMALRHLLDEAILSVDRRKAGSGDQIPSRQKFRAWLFARKYATALDRLFCQPAFAAYSMSQRSLLVEQLCLRGQRRLREALRRLTRDATLHDPLVAIRETLQAVGRDPATWSRQLVVLRAVQTLSVLDLNTYCDLVAELGEYDTRGEEIDDNATLV